MANQRYGHVFFGVDYSVPPHELPATAIADAQNILPNNSGLPYPRNGSVSLNNTSLENRITSFFELRSGTTRKQLCSYSTKIALYNSATREFGDLITGLTSNKMLQWVNFNGKAICVNEGSDAPQYYDGTDAEALPDSPPNGLCITEWSNRVWLGGNSTDVALLKACALNDPEDWSTSGTATGIVSQTVGDSKDAITGIFPFFDTLLVGKKNNIYKVVGDPATDATTLEIKPLYSKSSDNVGFTSPWAITQVGNDVIFLDGYDIKSLSGIQEFGDVEYVSIIPHFRDFLQESVDKNYLQYTQFFHYKKRQQIWVTIPTGSDSHYVFVLDYKFKQDTNRYSFYPMADLDINCLGGVEDGDIVNLYYGDEGGQVHQLDTGTNDNGSAIESFFTSVVSGNDPQEGFYNNHEIRKQFNYSQTFVYPSTDSLSLTPYYATDLMDSGSIRTSGNYTAISSEDVTGWDGKGVMSKRVRFFGVSGKTLALKWYHNTVAQSYVFYPSIINFTAKTPINIV